MVLCLGALLEGLCFTWFEIVSVGFFSSVLGVFQISELVAPSRLRVGGSWFSSPGVALECFLRKSKTDQVGRGAVVSLRSLSGSSTCPVQAFLYYSRLCRVGPSPLLVHEDGDFFSRIQFVQVFRKCLTRMVVEAKKYSSHSFHIGAETEAARWGLSTDAVMKIGRLQSDRYRLYVRPHLL